ncbi:RluA family pseudouridine synthase [Fulvivirgaceae bacterium BMA10]|uniref:RluA family pseudouridine synthase n=1 Tax=Splendidivirga corallicola TaxID=3051826 RepID=A0ABT8KJ67_9BACT|nr:RluA family pseudouridine synthase [Fulvivirgaceae bacterium BMA10]
MKRIDFESLILFEDDDYIVVNKPPLISSLDDRNDPINLLSLARDYAENAQVCHRLDKETSGAIAIAKNPEAYRALSIQFENRLVSKTYHAVVDGIHDFKEKEIDVPILVLGNGSVTININRGKESNTFVNTLQVYKAHTLLSCHPITGRMHQIRIHLSHIGTPIIGDTKYGGKPFFLSSIKRKYNLKRYTEEQPLIKRTALHSFGLRFEKRDGAEVSVEAPYPKDFNVLLKQLEKNV